VALGSTQPLTEMRTRNLLGGKGQQACKTDILTAICKLIVLKMWEPQCLTALGSSQPVIGIALHFFLLCVMGHLGIMLTIIIQPKVRKEYSCPYVN
jgi:hypothetical protein